MVYNFNTQEKVDGLFRESVSETASFEQNPCFLAYSQWYPTLFGVVESDKESSKNIDQGQGGYLVSVQKEGLYLLPLSRKNTRRSLYSPSKMRLGASSPIFLPRSEIVSIKFRPQFWTSPRMKRITLVMNSGLTYLWLVNSYESQLPYHRAGYQAMRQFAHSF